MREIRQSGSVEGVMGNHDSYSDSSVWFTNYWKGALRPGRSLKRPTRSWVGRMWLGLQHTPRARPMANSAYESRDHAFSALANLVACAVSFVDRIVFLCEGLIIPFASG